MDKVTQLTLVKPCNTSATSASEFVKGIIIAVMFKLLVGTTMGVGALWYAVLHSPGACR